MKFKLTQNKLDQIKAPTKGRVTIYDTEEPGLAVRITSNNARTFCVVKWDSVHGLMRWANLGEVGAMSIDEAREATPEKRQLIRNGINPNDAKRKSRDGATLLDLWNAYKVSAKTHANTWRHYEATWRRYLAPLARRRLDDITKNDVRKLHAKIAEGRMDRVGEDKRPIKGGPVAANRAIALLSIAYNAAGEEFGVTINPARGGRNGVKRPKEAPRERFLNDAEIGPFLQAVDGLEHDLAKDFIRLALFTGQRRANLQAMRWDDISLPFATWTIERGEMKGGRGHVVPLVPQAVAILERRRTADPKGEWVFPTSSASGHIEEPKKAITLAAKNAGITALSTHDLRRTCATWLNSLGASEGTIAALLAHKRQNVTGAVYVKATIDTVRGALVKAVDAMERAAGIVATPAAVSA